MQLRRNLQYFSFQADPVRENQILRYLRFDKKKRVVPGNVLWVFF